MGGRCTSLGEIVVNCLACLLCDFEANRSPSFTLTDGCSVERIPMRRHVSDFGVTTSHPRSLLSMARSNSARSLTRSNN